MPVKFAAAATWVSLASIKPYEKNAKVHPREQIDELKQQFLEHGFDVMIVVDPDMVIIKGHGRFASLTELDAEGHITDHKIPVIVRDDLSEEQVRLARLADNKLGESDWNVDMLSIEMLELRDVGANLELTGFDEMELKGLTEPKQSEPRSGAQELDGDDFEKFDHTCPKCSYAWNDEKKSKKAKAPEEPISTDDVEDVEEDS